MLQYLHSIKLHLLISIIHTFIKLSIFLFYLFVEHYINFSSIKFIIFLFLKNIGFIVINDNA